MYPKVKIADVLNYTTESFVESTEAPETEDALYAEYVQAKDNYEKTLHGLIDLTELFDIVEKDESVGLESLGNDRATQYKDLLSTYEVSTEEFSLENIGKAIANAFKKLVAFLKGLLTSFINFFKKKTQESKDSRRDSILGDSVEVDAEIAKHKGYDTELIEVAIPVGPLRQLVIPGNRQNYRIPTEYALFAMIANPLNKHIVPNEALNKLLETANSFMSKALSDLNAIDLKDIQDFKANTEVAVNMEPYGKALIISTDTRAYYKNSANIYYSKEPVASLRTDVQGYTFKTTRKSLAADIDKLVSRLDIGSIKPLFDDKLVQTFYQNTELFAVKLEDGFKPYEKRRGGVQKIYFQNLKAMSTIANSVGQVLAKNVLITKDVFGNVEAIATIVSKMKKEVNRKFE